MSSMRPPKVIEFCQLDGLRLYRLSQRNMIFSGHYKGLPIVLKAPRDDLPPDLFDAAVIVVDYPNTINSFPNSI